MKLVESKLRNLINPTQKAVIIAWTFSTEIDKKHLILNGFQKDGEDITNMWNHY